MNDGKDPVWTVRAVMNHLPEVRRILRSLRAAACRLAHGRLMASRGQADALEQVQAASRDLADLLKESSSRGFYVYEHAHRGIGLFPSWVTFKGDNRKTSTLFVYHDSRMTVQSYVVAEDLRTTCDLVACVRPIPEAWFRQEK